jgi:hypothetical protein
MNVDPYGRDVAVVIGSGIITNPFGHAAIGVTGQGIFSEGTGTKPGSNFSEFVRKQSEYRSSTIFELETTPEQDICIANAMHQSSKTPLPEPGLDAICNNCASRVADELRN